MQTASTTLHLKFNTDSPMLGYAVDGNPAVVTMWRGVPVSVLTDGRFDTTTSVPETALAGDLGFSETAGGMGLAFVVVALLVRQTRTYGYTYLRTRPVASAVVSMLLLGGLVVAIGGGILDGKPARLGPDLTATGAALVAAGDLSMWFGIFTRSRAGQAAAGFTSPPGMAGVAYGQPAPVPPTAAAAPTARPMPPRIRPAGWARILTVRAAGFIPVLLTAAVLLGVFLTSHDGPQARAFRHAPACSGETNLATCMGDFTAVINGVRAPANGAGYASVAYVTADGAINAWAQLDGDPATIVREASADEKASTPLTIRVWRGSIVGAEFGGSWHWAAGYPPGDTVPPVFLAISFGFLLLGTRLRMHRRAGSRASSSRLLLDDLGQIAAAAGSIVLLTYGFWPGAILAVAVLMWMGLSARRAKQRWRVPLAASTGADFGTG